jgi:hypothetical protein
VRSVIDDTKIVVVGNGLDGFNVARVTVTMYGHNRSGVLGYRSLDLGRVDIESPRLNINEHWLIVSPKKRMSRGYK